MTERKYLPTFAELVDRLSIVLLKSIYMPRNRGAYRDEMALIKHDLDTFIGTPSSTFIYAALVLMLANHTIWTNESVARSGGDTHDHLLKFTHAINGVRSRAKNEISQLLDERVDFKIDSYAASLPESLGHWNVFND
jgi:hypothetical protein